MRTETADTSKAVRLGPEQYVPLPLVAGRHTVTGIGRARVLLLRGLGALWPRGASHPAF